MEYVHQECLEQWLKSSNNTRCSICNHLFIFNKVYRGGQLSFSLIAYRLVLGLVHAFKLILISIFYIGACPLYTSFITSLSISYSHSYSLLFRFDYSLFIDLLSGVLIILFYILVFIAIFFSREYIIAATNNTNNYIQDPPFIFQEEIDQHGMFLFLLMLFRKLLILVNEFNNQNQDLNELLDRNQFMPINQQEVGQEDQQVENQQQQNPILQINVDINENGLEINAQGEVELFLQLIGLKGPFIHFFYTIPIILTAISLTILLFFYIPIKIGSFLLFLFTDYYLPFIDSLGSSVNYILDIIIGWILDSVVGKTIVEKILVEIKDVVYFSSWTGILLNGFEGFWVDWCLGIGFYIGIVLIYLVSLYLFTLLQILNIIFN